MQTTLMNTSNLFLNILYFPAIGSTILQFKSAITSVNKSIHFMQVIQLGLLLFKCCYISTMQLEWLESLPHLSLLTFLLSLFLPKIKLFFNTSTSRWSVILEVFDLYFQFILRLTCSSSPLTTSSVEFQMFL